MKKRIYHKVDSGHYHADACVIWCFDARFDDRFNKKELSLYEKFCKNHGFKKVDPVFIAGGVKALASPVDWWETEFVLRQIAKSVLLHDAKMIVLKDHVECGDYGRHFQSKSDAKKFYSNELKKGKKTVVAFLKSKKLKKFLKEKGVKRNTNKPVHLYYADFSGMHHIT